MSNQFIQQASIAISENPEPIFEKYLPGTALEEAGNELRLQPCPGCGHRDCCNITIEKPFIHCFSPGCGIKGTIVDLFLSSGGIDKAEFYGYLAKIYGLELPDSLIDREQSIRAITVEYYHSELIKMRNTLNTSLRSGNTTKRRSRSLKLASRVITPS